MFFSSYGSFVHSLLQKFYQDGATPQDLADTYLCYFKTKVEQGAPNQKVWESYFENGYNALLNLKPLPYPAKLTEQQYYWQTENKNFTGIIDYLGQDGDNLVLIDHKARALKPRSRRKTPTKTDGELDKYLRQLYLYAKCIKLQFHALPAKLCFNCYRTGEFIEEPFDKLKYSQTENWALALIKTIREDSDFEPNAEFFKCRNLCEVHNSCEYFLEETN